MKFGGSSLKDWNLIRQVAAIVSSQSKQDNVIVVLSAMKGVTDLLLEAAHKALDGDTSYRELINAIEDKHKNVLTHITKEQLGQKWKAQVEQNLNDLRNVLYGVELIRECSKRSKDFIMSFGELLNCLQFTAVLEANGVAVRFLDSRDVIHTDSSFGRANVLFDETNKAIQSACKKLPAVTVAPGFIASNENGITTTLGRNGSDYTASMYGAALDADVVEIWTDVDGVMSADPRHVKDAFVLNAVSVQEAMELSYFGAEVIHPATMVPIVQTNIPLRIRNTLNPETAGTLIQKNIQKHSHLITGLASIGDVSLVNIEGGGMMGLPGVASKVFNALAEGGINIIMISQASSEHSICVVTKRAEAGRAIEVLEQNLTAEISKKRIQGIQKMDELEIIAVIGENMHGTPGISGRVFSALGENNINILAIAQGSSELNISFLIKERDKKKALNVIHQRFFSGE